MAGLNKCMFIGNLGNDPGMRHAQNGTSVANFSIAATETWKDRDGQKQERTEWVRCVAWGKLADVCGQYLHKGSQVFVSGKMQTRKWQDKDGVDKYTTEIVVNELVMLGSKGRDNAEPEPPSGYEPSAGGGGYDDVPFAPVDGRV